MQRLISSNKNSSTLSHLRFTAILIILCLATSAWAVQSSRPTEQARRPKGAAAAPKAAQKTRGDADWQKYSAVIAELVRFETKLQQELQFPAVRGETRLLPLLPESTLAYLALPNYGNTLHQAALAFQKEREENPTLRNWWTNDVGADGKKIDDALDSLYQVSQYLGDEIVISGTKRGDSPVPLLLAEVKKPGLKSVLQQVDKALSTSSKSSLRILEPQDLAAAGTFPKDDALILVRQDFVVVAADLASLRDYNSLLEKHSATFGVTPFGQRLAQAYQGGAGIVFGADLQKILAAIPMKSDKDRMAFQRTGFNDLKYLVWEHRDAGRQSTSQSEISFNGPRRGIASWLANPGTLGGLDFVSPNPAIVVALGLKSPAAMLDDIRELTSDSNAMAALPMMESQLQVNLKQDLLSKLTGEIVIEMGPPVNQVPAWKLALRVNDASGLQQTLARLLAASSIEARQQEEAGVQLHSFMVPSGAKPVEINYAFSDGYLLIAPSRQAVLDAVQFHRSGASLAKSADFRSWLPPGRSAEASGFVYQNIASMVAPMLQQMGPDMSQMFAQLYAGGKPTVMWIYGENAAIREAHNSGAFDASVMLVGAAIAIPNLLHSRVAANDAAATASLRTVNTAEVTYEVTYPDKGYARNLAALGPAPGADCSGNKPSATHACLLDEALGCASGIWCTKRGYRFHVKGICNTMMCGNYVAVATPVSEQTGTKSYCSTSDAVIRTHAGPPLTAPISYAECQKWQPLF